MMKQAQEPPREQRFDLQQMLRELAVEVASGGVPMSLAPTMPPRPTVSPAGGERAPEAHGASPQIQPDQDHG
jgi:hypothetical protein